MSLTATYGLRLTAAGVDINVNFTRTADAGIEPLSTSVAAGKTVTDWVKTDANTAGCNLPGGHGYTDGKMTAFWEGGCRYDVDGTIVTNALTLDGGAGDDFPANGTTVVVCKQTEHALTFDGDNLVVLGIAATKRSIVIFKDSGPAVLAAVEIAAGEAWSWLADTGAANPLTGNAVATVDVANGDATDASDITMTGLQDA